MTANKYTRIYIVPIVLFVEFLGSIILTLIIGLYNGKIVVFMPYVSDLGAHPPHGCIFGQMLNICALLMMMVVYLRYRFTKELVHVHNLGICIKCCNLCCYVLGIIAAIGVSVVGNFPETTMFIMHIVGAGSAFSLGTVYQIIETVISWLTLRYIGSKWMAIARTLIALINIVTVLKTGLFMVLALLIFDGDDISQWTPEHEGFTFHAISAINEWIYIIATMGFLTTFAYEFGQVIVYEPEFEIIGSQA